MKPTFLPSRFTVKSTFKPFLSWNQHFLTYSLHEITTLVLSKWNQHSCLHALPWNPHSNFFELKSTFLSLYVAWNKNLVPLKVKSTFLPSCDTVKSTSKSFLNWNWHFWAYSLHEIKSLVLSKWNQHSYRHTLPWNPHSNLFWAKINTFDLIYVTWN